MVAHVGAGNIVRKLGQQPQAPEACVPFATDDEMVVDRDAERVGCSLDLARHLDVVAAWFGVPARVIVDQPIRRSVSLI